ncbi:MAG: hypothetical protein U9R24_03315 [Thermodesulfobacteriota bacterium]|nr:hypothetical protein [Thermodesulfobacteriota bacterium]
MLRKAILFIFLILACGCSFSDNKSDLKNINPGLYEFILSLTYEDQQYVVRQVVRYNADGSYMARTYNSNIAVDERRGRYKIEEDRLFFSDKYERIICKDGTWTPWKMAEPSSIAIRNLCQDGYEYYMEPINEEQKAQFRALGIKEGWKKFERISG